MLTVSRPKQRRGKAWVWAAAAVALAIAFLFALYLPSMRWAQTHLAPPSDFQLTARFYPGHSYWSNWEVRISSRGEVWDDHLDSMRDYLRDRREVLRTGKFGADSAREGRPLDRDGRERISREIAALDEDIAKRSAKVPARISDVEMRRLFGTVYRTDFMRLPGIIKPSPPAPGEAALELRVRAGGATHEVTLHAYDQVRGRKEARRFAELWRHVMELVPPSNSEQKVEDYR